MLLKTSIVAGIYDALEDRESAYEKLMGRVAERIEKAETAPVVGGTATTPPAADEPGFLSKMGGMIGDVLGSPNSPRSRQSVGEAAMKSAARAIGSEVGRRVIRGVLGSIFGGKR